MAVEINITDYEDLQRMKDYFKIQMLENDIINEMESGHKANVYRKYENGRDFIKTLHTVEEFKAFVAPYYEELL